MQRGGLLYEGKAKQVYATDDAGLRWIHFKDSATAFDGVKKAEIAGKGEVNCRVSAHRMRLVDEATGLPTHLHSRVDPLR